MTLAVAISSLNSAIEPNVRFKVVGGAFGDFSTNDLEFFHFPIERLPPHDNIPPSAFMRSRSHVTGSWWTPGCSFWSGRRKRVCESLLLFEVISRETDCRALWPSNPTGTGTRDRHQYEERR